MRKLARLMDMRVLAMEMTLSRCCVVMALDICHRTLVEYSQASVLVPKL